MLLVVQCPPPPFLWHECCQGLWAWPQWLFRNVHPPMEEMSRPQPDTWPELAGRGAVRQLAHGPPVWLSMNNTTGDVSH